MVEPEDIAAPVYGLPSGEAKPYPDARKKETMMRGCKYLAAHFIFTKNFVVAH
jgi:hypothetical protein